MYKNKNCYIVFKNYKVLIFKYNTLHQIHFLIEMVV